MQITEQDKRTLVQASKHLTNTAGYFYRIDSDVVEVVLADLRRVAKKYHSQIEVVRNDPENFVVKIIDPLAECIDNGFQFMSWEIFGSEYGDIMKNAVGRKTTDGQLRQIAKKIEADLHAHLMKVKFSIFRELYQIRDLKIARKEDRKFHLCW